MAESGSFSLLIFFSLLVLLWLPDEDLQNQYALSIFKTGIITL